MLTGGCGFIGSAVVRHLLHHTDHVVINVDKMTYAASEDALEDGLRNNRHLLIKADIADPASIKALFAKREQLDSMPVNELMAALVTNGAAK